MATAAGGDRTVHSVAVISLGHGATRVLVTDRVEGEPRLLASVMVSGRTIRQALDEIEHRIGRSLVDNERPLCPRTPLGDGADRWVVVGAPARIPVLALVVVGDPFPALSAVEQVTHASLVRSARFAVDATTRPTLLAQHLSDLEPDFLVLAGGPNDDAWRVVSAALETAFGESKAPQVGIVVAPEAIQEQLAALLGDRLELMGSDPNQVAPTDIMSALAGEFRQRATAWLTDEVRPWAVGAVVDRLTALERAAAFLVRRAEQRLVLADLECGVLALWARPEGMATTAHAARDLGRYALSLGELDPKTVLRWLPWPLSEEDLLDWLANRRLDPHPLVLDENERLVASAVIREAFRHTADSIPRTDIRHDVSLIVLGPWFATLPPALAVLTALDAFEPIPATGLVSIALDEADLLAACGALADSAPGYAAALLERDALLPLAHVAVLTGEGTEGAIAVRGEVQVGALTQRFSVPWGSLHVLSIPPGQTAELTLEPEAGVRVGGLDPGLAVRFNDAAAIAWAQLGIVIDARGRPLQLPGDSTARIRRLRSWLTDLGLTVGSES